MAALSSFENSSNGNEFNHITDCKKIVSATDSSFLFGLLCTEGAGWVSNITFSILKIWIQLTFYFIEAQNWKAPFRQLCSSKQVSKSTFHNLNPCPSLWNIKVLTFFSCDSPSHIQAFSLPFLSMCCSFSECAAYDYTCLFRRKATLVSGLWWNAIPNTIHLIYTIIKPGISHTVS